ncbi:MAG: hypothetical protein ACI4M8_02170, partial [Christensenellales bacterium]
GEKLYQLADGTIYTIENGKGITEDGAEIDISTLTLNEKLKDREFIRAHIGVIDYRDEEKEFFYVDLVLADTVNISRTDAVTLKGTFTASEYTNIADWATDLQISVDAELELGVSAEEDEKEWDKLYDILQQIIGGDSLASFDALLKTLAVRFYNDYFASTAPNGTKGLAIGLSVRGTINVADILASELSVVMFDKASADGTGFTASDGGQYEVIIGIYLKDNKAYVDLSYFGMDLLNISDVRNTYNSIRAAQFDMLWAATYVAEKTGEEIYAYKEEEAFLDEAYRQQMLGYFLESQYAQYKEKSGDAKGYYEANFPTSTYKYLVWNERIIQAGEEEERDYSKLYYGSLKDHYGIYVYVAADIAKYFNCGAADNTLKLLPGHDRYEVLADGTIRIYEDAESYVTVSPILREGTVVRINIAEVQNKMETNSYGESEFVYELFEAKIKGQTYENYKDFIAKFVGYWNATRGNNTGVDAYMNNAYQENIASKKEYYRLLYLNSTDYVTDLSNLSASTIRAVQALGGDYAKMSAAEIRNTPEYQKRYLDGAAKLIDDTIASKAAEDGIDNGYSDKMIAYTMLSIMNSRIIANNGVYAETASYAAAIKAKSEELAPSNAATIIGPDKPGKKSYLTDEGAIALQLVYNKGKITLELVEEVISAFITGLGYPELGELLDINYLGVGIDLSAGIGLDVMLQLGEIYSINLSIKNLEVSVDPDERDKYAVKLNDAFNQEGAVGIPDAIYVEASIGLTLQNVVKRLAEEEGLATTDYDLTALLDRFLSNSKFKAEDVNAIYNEIAARNPDADETTLKQAAWLELYKNYQGVLTEETLAQKNELDGILEKTWATIEKEKANYNEEYANTVYGDAKHYALSWDKLASTAVKVDLTELGVEVLFQLFENINATLFVDAEAWIDFNNIYSSSLKVSIKRWIGQDGEYIIDENLDITEILTNDEKRARAEEVFVFYYDGSVNTSYNEFRGSVYIDTEIFGIGQVKLEDVTVIWAELFKYVGTDMFGSDTIKSVYKFFGLDENGNAVNAAKALNAAMNAGGAKASNAAGGSKTLKTYIDIMFRKGELGVGVAKDAVLNVLNLFAGIDLSEQLENKIDFDAEVMLNFMDNLGININLNLENGDGEKSKIKLGVGEINIKLKNDIDPADEEKFVSIEKLASVGAAIGGYAAFELGGMDDTFSFDYLFELLYGYAFDRNPELGLQVGIDEGDVFAQANYLEIRANANLLTLSSFEDIELYITLTSQQNHATYLTMAPWRELMDEIAERSRNEEGEIDYEEAWVTLRNEVGSRQGDSTVFESERAGLESGNPKFFISVMDDVEGMASLYGAIGDAERYEKHWKELYGRCGDYYMGNVMSLFVTLAKGDESKGQSPIYGQIYLNFAFLGVEPIVLEDISAFVVAIGKSFGLDYSKLFQKGEEEEETPSNAASASYAAESALATIGRFLIGIDTRKNQDVIVAEVTSAALYSILAGLGLGDIEKYFGENPDGGTDNPYYPGYSPNVKVNLFDYNEDEKKYDLLGVELKLENLLELKVAIETPSIDIARGNKRLSIKEYEKQDNNKYVRYYTTIDEAWDTTLKLSVEGQLDLKAKDSATLKDEGELEGSMGSEKPNEDKDKQTINLGDLLRIFLGDNFNVDVIIDTQQTIGADLYFYIDATVNVMSIFNLIRKEETTGKPMYEALGYTIPQIISAAGAEAYIEIVSREKAVDAYGDPILDENGNEIIEKETVIIGIYLVKERGDDNEEYLSLYVDLGSLHISPIKIKNLTGTGSDIWANIGKLFGSSEEETAAAKAETEREAGLEMFYVYTALKAKDVAASLGAKYASLDGLRAESANFRDSYGGLDEGFDGINALIDANKGNETGFIASNAGGTALEDFIAIVVGNEYGVTVTAVAAVLIKMLDEAFNDEGSISRRAFDTLVDSRIEAEIEAERKVYDNVAKYMESLLEGLAGDKAEAWIGMTEDNKLPAAQKAEAETMYNNVVAKAAADGYTVSKNEKLLQQIAWDGFYWSLAGVKYEDATEIYPITEEEGKPVTLDKFTKYTGLTITESDALSGIVGSFEDLLDQAKADSARAVLNAVEYSEYYGEAAALDSYIQYVEDMLYVLNSVYAMARTLNNHPTNRETYNKQIAYDLLTENNGSRTYKIPAARNGVSERDFRISNSDYELFTSWKQAYLAGYETTSEVDASAKTWADIAARYQDAYAQIISALKYVNNRAYNMFYDAGEEITEYPFTTTVSSGVSYYENITVKEKYETFNSAKFSSTFKAYVWEYLNETGGIEDTFETLFMAASRKAIANEQGICTDNFYKYYAWASYYADVKAISAAGYQYVIARNCKYVLESAETNKEVIYHIEYEEGDKDASGRTTWSLVKLEDNLLVTLEDIYMNSSSDIPNAVISTANGVGTAQVGLLHNDKLVSVRVWLGNFELGLAFVRAGLYLKDFGLDKPVYYKKEIVETAKYEQGIDTVSVSEYLESLPADHFAEFNKDFKYVYASLQLDFSLDSDKTTFNLEQLIDTLMTELGINIELGGNTIGLSLILQTLESISKDFRLEIEARANLFDLFAADFNTSDVAITLYALEGNSERKVLQLALGSYVDEEDGQTKNFVYVDFSRFNIQHLIIRDAIEYVRQLLGGNAAQAFAPYDPDYVDSFGGLVGAAASYGAMLDAAQQAASGDSGDNEAITIALRRSGLTTTVASGAIYALLNFFGIGMIEKYVSQAVDVELGVDIFAVDDELVDSDYDDSDRDLIRLSIALNSLGKDGEGTDSTGIRLDFGIHTIELSLDQKKFVLGANSNAGLEEKLDLPVNDKGEKLYAEVKEELPNIVVSTTLELQIKAGYVLQQDFNKSPISDILNSLTKEGNLASIIGQILFEIYDNHDMTVAIDVGADIDLGDGSDNNYVDHILKGSVVRIQIRAWHTNEGNASSLDEMKNKVWASIIYYDGALYVDLSALGIQKVKFSDVASLIFGSGSNAADRWNAIGNAWYAATTGSADKAMLGATIYGDRDGIYAMIEKAAINSLIGIFGFGDLSIFNDALLELYLEAINVGGDALSLGLGLNVAFKSDGSIFKEESGIIDPDRGNSDIDATLVLHLGVRGIYIGFRNLEDWSPKSPTEYRELREVNVLQLGASVYMDMGDKNGIYELKDLLNAVLEKMDVNLGLSKELQAVIDILDSREVRFEISVDLDLDIGTVINDIISGNKTFGDIMPDDITTLLAALQAKLTVNIIREGKETTSIAVSIIRGDVYLDLSGLNKTLGKGRIPDALGLIGTLLGGEAQNGSYVAESASAATESLAGLIDALIAAQNGSPAVTDEELAAQYLRFGLSGVNGLTVTVVYGAVKSVIRYLLGAEALADVIDMVTLVGNPEASLNLGYDVELGLRLRVPSTVFDDDDFNELNALISDAKNYFGFAADKVMMFTEDMFLDSELAGQGYAYVINSKKTTADEFARAVSATTGLYAAYVKSDAVKAAKIDEMIMDQYAPGGVTVETYLANFKARYAFYGEEDCKAALYDYLLIAAYSLTDDKYIKYFVGATEWAAGYNEETAAATFLGYVYGNAETGIPAAGNEFASYIESAFDVKASSGVITVASAVQELAKAYIRGLIIARDAWLVLIGEEIDTVGGLIIHSEKYDEIYDALLVEAWNESVAETDALLASLKEGGINESNMNEYAQAAIKKAYSEYAYEYALGAAGDRTPEAVAYEKLTELLEADAANGIEGMRNDSESVYKAALWRKVTVYTYTEPKAVAITTKGNLDDKIEVGGRNEEEAFAEARDFLRAVTGGIEAYALDLLTGAEASDGRIMLDTDTEITLAFDIVFDVKSALADLKEIFGGVPGDVMRQLFAYIGKQLAEAGYDIPGLEEGRTPSSADYRRLFEEKYALNAAVLAQFVEGSEIYETYMKESFSADAWDELVGTLDFSAATEEEFIAVAEAYISNPSAAQGKLYESLISADKETLMYILVNIYNDYSEARKQISSLGGSGIDELLTDVFGNVSVDSYAPNAIGPTLEGMLVNGFKTNNVYNMAFAFLAAKSAGASGTVYDDAEACGPGFGITDKLLNYAIAYGNLLKSAEGSSATAETIAAAALCRAYYGAFTLDKKYVTADGYALGANEFATIAALVYADASMTYRAELELAAYYYGMQGAAITIAPATGFTENETAALNALKAANSDGSPEKMLKDAAYRRVLRSSSTTEMYEEYLAVRSSLVFEMIYRNSAETREALKSIILVSANQTINNMASSVIGSTSSFTSDNVDIYYEIYGEEFSKEMGELVLEIYEENESINEIIDESLHTLVYEVLYDKMSLKENASAIIATYREAKALAASLSGADYANLKSFYDEFDADIKEFVTQKGNLPTVVEELLSNETYTKNATLGELTGKETLEYYRAIVAGLGADADKAITANLKDEINAIGAASTSGTASVVTALYEEVKEYFSVDGGMFNNRTEKASEATNDESSSSWNSGVTTETQSYELVYSIKFPSGLNFSALSGANSIWRLTGIDSVLKNPVQADGKGTKITLSTGDAVPAEWMSSGYTDSEAEPWIKTTYEAKSAFSITYTYPQADENNPTQGELTKAMEAQTAALEEYKKTDDYKTKVAALKAQITAEFDADLGDVRKFIGTLLGTETVPTNGYYNFPTSGSEKITFANVVKAATNAETLYNHAAKGIGALNAWKLERTPGSGFVSATFADFSLNALESFYNYLKPSDNRDYIREYMQIKALIDAVNALQSVNGIIELNTAETPKFKEKKTAADKVYAYMNQVGLVEGNDPASPKKVRSLVYAFYELYGNASEGAWMSESSLVTPKGRTLTKILEDVATETQALTFEYYGYTIYRLLDKMTQEGKTLGDGAALRTTEEWYAFIADMRKSDSVKEQEIFDRVLYTVILFTCMDEADTPERDKENVITLTGAAQILYMTDEELAIFAEILYNNAVSKNGGYYPFDYTLPAYNGFFGISEDERSVYAAINAENIVESALRVQNGGYGSGIVGTKPSELKNVLASKFVNLISSVEEASDTAFGKEVFNAASKAADAGLSGTEANVYAMYSLFGYFYGKGNAIEYPNYDAERYFGEAWEEFTAFVFGESGTGYSLNGKTRTWYELLLGRELDTGYNEQKDAAFVNAYAFVADKAEFVGTDTPYDEIYNAVFSDFKTLYSEKMVPGASLAGITGIKDLLAKIENVKYSADYTDFVKLATVVEESYSAASESLAALDASYGLTEEDVAAYAGILAVRDALCLVYSSKSFNFTVYGAVSRFAIEKVFALFAAKMLENKTGTGDYSTLYNYGGAKDVVFYDDYVLYPSYRTGEVKTIFDGITALEGKEQSFGEALVGYVTKALTENDALTALFGALETVLGTNVKDFIGSEAAQKGYKAASELIGLISVKDYGVSGLTDLLKNTFRQYSAKTGTPTYLAYKYDRYASALAETYDDLYNALYASSADRGIVNETKYVEAAATGVAIVKANALIDLVGKIEGGDVGITDETAKALYETARAAVLTCENASGYLTEKIWEDYYGGVSRENLADDFDAAYKAMTAGADSAVIDAMDEVTRKELSDAYALPATSGSDATKAKAMFTLANAVSDPTALESAVAATIIGATKEAVNKYGLTAAAFGLTAAEWRKTYGGVASEYGAVTVALGRKTLLDRINAGGAEQDELIAELLGGLEFTDMADYLDEYIGDLRYNEREAATDYAESGAMLTKAFAKNYNAAAATRYDIAEIDLGLGVEFSKIYVGAEVDPDGVRDDLVPEAEQGEYVDYDEMKLYLSFGGFFSFGFGEGKTDVAQMVNIILGSLNISEIYLEFLKTHIMYGSLKAEIALDIAKALSKDEAQIKQSLTAAIVMQYALIDNDERGETKRFEQQIISIYVYDGAIYLSVEIFDMKLNLKLEFDAMGYLLGLLGITEQTETATENLGLLNAAVSALFNGWDGEKALEKGNPVGQLVNAAATNNSKEILEAIVRIGSGEAGLILTVDILLEVMNLLMNDNEATDALNDLILMVFTSGSAKIEYGEDFGINLNISKNRTVAEGNETVNNLSYDVNLGLFNDTVFSMNSVTEVPGAKDYFSDFIDGMNLKKENGYFDTFYAMELDILGMLNASSTGSAEFDVGGLVSDIIGDRLQVGVSLEFDSEVLRTVVDWSKLFSAMGSLSVEPIFILRVFNSASGTIRLDVSLDLDISKVNFDFSLRAYNNGVNIFNVYELSGTLNTDGDPYFSPKFYFDMGDVGPEKFVVTAQSLYEFMKINFMEMFLDLVSDKHDEVTVERADNGIFGEDTALNITELDFGKILQSVTFGQGTLGIRLSEALLNTLIKVVNSNWEFDDMGNIRFDVDMMQNIVEITVPLDAAVRDADGNVLSDSKLTYAVRLSNINLHIGEAVDFIGTTGKENYSAFEEYNEISKYVWITETNSSLGLHNDDENTIVDLSGLTMKIIDGLGIKLRNGESLLDVSLDFVLRTYIDFSDLGNLGFELLINRRGRTLIGLTFIGAENDGSLYVNLEGLGLPQFYITGVDIGGMLTELLQKIEKDVSFGDDETAANADGSISGSISSGDKGAIDYGSIADAGISGNLLLALVDENVFNVAMTGALLLNLLGTIDGVRDISALIPTFANLQLGYEKDKLSGIKLVYDEGQHFSIDYNFRKSYTYLVPKRDLFDEGNPAYDDARSHMVKSSDKTSFVNVDNLKNVNIGLTLDLTLVTVNPDGTKSEVVEELETLLETLLGMDEGSVDLQFQDMYASITVLAEIVADLTDLNNSKLKIEIIYNDVTLIGIYYLEGKVYLDLGKLGLMEASINGVDLMGALSYFMGGSLPIDFDEEKGLDIKGLITNLINVGTDAGNKGTTDKTGTSIEEKAVSDAINALKANYAERYKAGEFDDLTATEQEAIKEEISNAIITINGDNGNVLTESEYEEIYKEIVKSIGFRVKGSILEEVTEGKKAAVISLSLYNDRIEIAPSSQSLGALLGVNFPNFTGIVVSMNLDAGLTNLALNVNIHGNNKLSLSLPEAGGIRLGLNLTDAEIT